MKDRRTPLEVHGDHEWERVIARLTRDLAVARAEADRYRDALLVIAEQGEESDRWLARAVLT